MRDRNRAACGVVHRDRRQVLYQRSATPHVHRLGSEADGEERLVKVVRVLDQEFVDVLARRVGGIALRDGLVAVLVRIDVGGRAGKQDALTGVDQVGGGARGGVERNLDRLAPGTADGLGVLGPGAGVVLGIGAGGDGNGDSRLHGL